MSSRAMSDEVLARLARSGDSRAMARLCLRLDSGIYNFARLRGATDDEAETVTSETLEDVVRTIGQFQGKSRFRTWVLAIARNRLNRLIRNRTPEPVPLEACYEIPGSALLEPAERERQRREVQLCNELLDQLPEAQREAARLVWLEGLTGTEAGAALGISVAGVGMLLRRAMAHLRRAAARRAPVSDCRADNKEPTTMNYEPSTGKRES